MSDRHFAEGAIKRELEPLFPVAEEERFRFLPLPLPGTKAQLVTATVFGAHELSMGIVTEFKGAFRIPGSPSQRQGVDAHGVQL